MARQKRKYYSCDFETTTTPNDCRVWAWGWMEIGNTKNYAIGTDINDFMTWLEKCQGNCYFHNLRFDGEFIVNHLLRNGWEYSEDGEPGTFKTTISSMGLWYMIDICYGYHVTKSGKKEKRHTVIYDSYKKLPFTVKKIAKDFKLSVLKGDIDYHAYRPVGHKLTEQETEYLIHDIQIIAEALEIQFSQGLKNMTNGSDALKGYKDIFGVKEFDKFFPEMNRELFYNMKPAYKGGFTWLNKKYAERYIGEGMTFDVNSLYPSQMYERLLPYGVPVFFEGEYQPHKKYPLFIQHIRCEFELKEGYIPTIQIKKDPRFKGNEYLESSEFLGDLETVDLYLTNVDLELFLEHYHVYNPEYVDGWMFRGKVGLFKNYIEKWMAIKVNPNSTSAIVTLSKLMLNSLYGKFATDLNVTPKIPKLAPDESTMLRLPRDENNKIEEKFRDPVYLPMGIFITSWARYTTITTAQKCYNRIIYCDTDSIHLEGLGIPEVIKDIVHDKKLGYWAHENTFKQAYYIRQKTYAQILYAREKRDKVTGELVLDDDEKVVIEPCKKEQATTELLSIKCAGMPDTVKKEMSFEDFKRGYTHETGKLKPLHVKGGVVLVPSPFTIK